VEKNQYKLCIEVLKRLEKSGVLKQIVLIGSWCIPFYKEYFSGVKFLTSIRTRDIDFLIPNPSKIAGHVDIAELMKDLGFIVGYKGSKGVIKLEHPDLAIEFLVPEKGRGTNEPYPLPELGVNAQALRFLNFLTDGVVTVEIENIALTIPHPINFALHKLIIFQRRKNDDKAQKDMESALRILKAVVEKGETDIMVAKFNGIPKGWQQKILMGLKKAGDSAILDILKQR